MPVRMAQKLTDKRLELPPFTSMYVNMAAQVLSHSHGRRKRGVCRGSDTRNYLCGGDIDMYIPLEKNIT